MFQSDKNLVRNKRGGWVGWVSGEGGIKNDATHKVCTSALTELALGEFTKEQFEFKKVFAAGRNKGRRFTRVDKRERERER